MCVSRGEEKNGMEQKALVFKFTSSGDMAGENLHGGLA